jgi:hypothetical protein
MALASHHCRSAFPLAFTLALSKFRRWWVKRGWNFGGQNFGDVGGDAPGLVAGEQIAPPSGVPAPPRSRRN